MQGKPMPRQLATNAELTKMINDRLSERNELGGDCRDVRVSGVHRYPEPDETGCNWTVYGHHGPLECQEVRELIVDELRRQYNLADED